MTGSLSSGALTPMALLLLLAACVSADDRSVTAPPPPEPPSPPATFVADATVAPTGRFALDRVETSTLRHGMEHVFRESRRIVVTVEIGPDATARVCTRWASERTTDVGEYASTSGEHEHSRSDQGHATGWVGTVAREGADVLLRLDREAGDCAPAAERPRAGRVVRCSPGRLDGHEVLACDPDPAIGGDGAVLPHAPARVLLGRDGLRAASDVSSTTIEPAPDPAARERWTLAW